MLKHLRPWGLAVACVAAVLLIASVVGAAEAAADPAPPAEAAPAEPPVTADSVLADASVLWTCLAAFLVFFMQAGFALVECGLTRAKNACNILMKNLMDFCIGSIAFWLLGFGLMFGASAAGNWAGWFGTNNFVFDAARDAVDLGKSESFGWAFLLFQTVFAATAATIVSGAMAERTKFISYLIYSAAISIIIYPIYGKWAWGSLWADAGWLEAHSFIDFAGSTVVHSIGGWCALAGAMVIGPRLGKYGKDGRIHPIPGHSIPMAALGVFILWLGWFGFNPGSTTAVDHGNFAKICITTNLAACAGALGALITSWLKFKKPDVSFTFNGALAGLVAITAGCNNMSPAYSAVTGFLAGILVVFAVLFFDRVKIDDPVGAVSVHLVCGAFGTLAVGLFGVTDEASGLLLSGEWGMLKSQAIGVGVAGLWAFPCALILFSILKATVGLRVSPQEEMEGLDLHEHGNHAYPPALIAAENTGIMSGSPAPAGVAYSATVSVPASANV
ncbi:MAG: ammonium transporter [Pirellulales bacterium]